MSYRQKCAPFQNVGANQVATVSLQCGMTYKRIQLALGGTSFTKAMITEIKVKVNTRTIWQISGTDLDSLNKYRGIYDAAGYLTLDFAELKAKTTNGEMLGSLDTSVISNFNLEVKIGAATAPTLVAWAELDDPQLAYDALGKPQTSAAQMVVSKILMIPVNFGTAGDTVLDNFPKGANGTLIKRIHVFSTGQQINSSEIKINGMVIDEMDKGLMDFQLREYGRVPQATGYHIDFIKDGNLSNMLDTRGSDKAPIRSLLAKFNLAAASAATIYIECVDAIGNI